MGSENDTREYEHLLEALRRARRTVQVASPELREENLRRLVRAAIPEEEASDALKQRVESLIIAGRTRPT